MGRCDGAERAAPGSRGEVRGGKEEVMNKQDVS